jgi:hypothetical protein
MDEDQPVLEEEEQPDLQKLTLAEKHGRYYHAHNRPDRDPDAPIDIWAENLKKTGVFATKLATTTVDAATLVKPRTIQNYAWCDEDSTGKKDPKATVYVTLPGIGQHPDGDIQLSFTPRSVTLELTQFDSKDHVLKLHLANAIKTARFRKKADKIVITLIKKNSFKWYDLTTKDNQPDAAYLEEAFDFKTDEKAQEAVAAAGAGAAAAVPAAPEERLVGPPTKPQAAPAEAEAAAAAAEESLLGSTPEPAAGGGAELDVSALD